MDLGMNWVDLAIIFILILFAWEAQGRPFFLEILDFISFLLAFFLSFRFYNLTAKFYEVQFDIPRSLSMALGFVTTWFLAEVIFSIFSRIFLQGIDKQKVSKFWMNPNLSIIPAVLRSMIFISLVLVILSSFPVQPQVKKSIQESKIGSYMLARAYQLENPVKNVFGGITQDTLTFLTLKPKTDESVNLGFKATDLKIDENTEFAMISLVNQERTSRGLPALQFDPKLRDVGRYHSKDMMTRGYFSHYSPEGKSVADRAEMFGVSYMVIGENLAYAPSLELAHNGLMNSPGHRANILSPDYKKIGIGVVDGGVYGMMFTQVFTD